MPLRRLVERGSDHFPKSALLHLGDFLGAFVHQEDDQMAFGIVCNDALGHGLENGGLSGLGRRHDHRALSLAKRTDEIDDPVGIVWLTEHRSPAFEHELLIRVCSTKPLELGARSHVLRRPVVDALQMRERRALSVSSLPDDTHQLVSGTKAELLDHAGAHVDVVVAGGIPGLPTPNEAGAATQNLEQA